MKLKEIIEFIDKNIPKNLALENDEIGFKKEYNLNIDFSSLSFTFEISQELEYKLLNNLSLNINFKDTEKLYSLFLNIDKISEMNSSSEFVENKYVF